MAGIVEKIQDLVGKLSGKKQVPEGGVLPPEEPVIATPSSEPEDVPKAKPVEEKKEEPKSQEPEKKPLPEIGPLVPGSPEQKFFEAIDRFSVEDLRKRKGDLEKMLKLADEELACGIISQGAYGEIRKNAGEKLKEVTFELKAVEKLLKRISKKPERKKRLPRKAGRKRGKKGK